MSSTAELSRKVSKAVSDVATDAAQGESDFQLLRDQYVVALASQLQKSFPECRSTHALKGATALFNDSFNGCLELLTKLTASKFHRDIPVGTVLKISGASKAKFIRHSFFKNFLEEASINFIAAAKRVEKDWRSGTPVVERSHENPHSSLTINHLPSLKPL